MDREKVIKGVECCHNENILWNHDLCPYHGFDSDCESRLLADTIALLKEQEPVKPILKREGKSKRYNDYVCPVCDNEVVYEQNFCYECGKPLNWD